MNKELLLALEREYGLPSIVTTQDVATGVLSSNWILHTDDTKYFLKRYRYSERARIDSVHAVKIHFNSAGIPVIMPLVTRSGETCYTHTDGRHFALFPYIVAAEAKRGALSDTSIVSMAEMLAKLHLAGREVHLENEIPTFSSWNKEEFLKKAEPILKLIHDIKDPTPFDSLALQDLQEKCEFIETNNITFESLQLPTDHLLHGDYLDHNLFFDETNHVSHVFDWEKVGYGPRVYELLRTIFLSVFDGELTFERSRQATLFIRTYRAHYPISNDEISQGLTLFRIKLMYNSWIQKEHYILQNYRADKFLTIERKRQAYLVEQLPQLEAILLEHHAKETH